MRKVSFEWVVVMSDGTEHILTPNQYDFYKENWTAGQMFFRDFSINPSFVTQVYKRPAEELFKLYPCKTCNTNGHLAPDAHGNYPECSNCKGTGIDLKP